MFRIALIEHDVNDLQAMTQLCMEHGQYEVVLATAFPGRVDRLIEEYRPDAMILDANMPGKDAFAVMHMIEERGWNIEVILVNDQPDFNSAVRALRCGVCDYYLKPLMKHSFDYMLDRLALRLRAKQKPASVRLAKQGMQVRDITRTA